MRIPISWLREYVEVPEGDKALEVLSTLVKVGLEEEKVHRFLDGLLGPVVVGEVLGVVAEKHSNGKVVNWCQVDVGIGESVGIVCGAHNFVVGDKVVVALPGAVLPGGFEISARKTYGHVSQGMIVSSGELGLDDDGSGGIIVLSEWGLSGVVGEDALVLLGLDDEVAEVNVTPDRGYCLSLRGIAREYSHASGVVFRDPCLDVVPLVIGGDKVSVDLSGDSLIRGNLGVRSFFVQRVVNINVNARTPYWMASRLRMAGMRSVSLLVDISNYVMLEFGQPIHIYDLKEVSSSLGVRRARVGEVLETLDGRVRSLDLEDLVVVDAVGPLGIAGVMGGSRGEVSATTCEVLVEVANFDSVSVARSARRHKIFSESAKRFERGVDPVLGDVSLARVVALLADLAGGEVFGGPNYVFGEGGVGFGGVKIFLPGDYVSGRIGYDYTQKQIVDSLCSIGAEVSVVSGGFEVVPPSWRNDLCGVAELSEEVARIVGYEFIPKRLPSVVGGAGLSVSQKRERSVLRLLADLGLSEVFSYPFVTESAAALFASSGVVALELENPISFEQRFLRTSVLPGLFDILKRNFSRGNSDVAIFEAGVVFLRGQGSVLGCADLPGVLSLPDLGSLEELDGGIPFQPKRLGVLLSGSVTGVSFSAGEERCFDWADALDVVRSVGVVLGVDLGVSRGEHVAWHPGRTASIVLPGGRVCGFAGELHPRVVRDFQLPDRLVALELDLSGLLGVEDLGVKVFGGLSGFPVATQDISLEVVESVSVAEVLGFLRDFGGDLLEDVVLFDIYRGDSVASGCKSLAFSLRFRAVDRTLTALEVSEIRESLVVLAGERFDARQR